MGRRLRQTVTALATTALAAAAIVAVFHALPDGHATEPAADAARVSTSAVTPMTTAPQSSTGTRAAVSVPALDTPDTTALGGLATDTTPVSSIVTGASPAGTSSTDPSPTGTIPSDPSPTRTAPPTAPSPPAAPSAPQVPAVTTTPGAATPKTAAPKTAAPRTTAAPATKTAAPKTTTSKTTPKAPPAPSFGIPVTTGNAKQVITVTAASKSATSGTLRAWQQQADGSWKVAYGPVKAWLGKQGIGTPSEYASRTPQGTYTLTQAFGIQKDPGTALPYHVTGANDWWVSDTRAATYNTLQTCAPASCPFNTKVSERLHYIAPYYDYAVVMDVNRSPVVPGGGSAFFLHVSVGAPTEGCVAIDKATLVDIVRWLDPAQHPRIAVGVG